MGVERAVTRWYALRQVLDEEMKRLEADIAQSSSPQREAGLDETETLQRKLSEAQERLRLLGPCPRPMMG